jgi:hypothetical protein
MLENILLVNLFLVSNSLITLAFIFYGWIYLDLYIKRKKKYALSIAVGGFLLAFSYITAIYFELTEIGLAKNYVFITLQFLGLLLVAFGYTRDIVPQKTKSSKLKSFAFPLLFPTALLVNFVLASFISAKILHKINYGRSKEFYPLFFFWIVIALILLLNFFSIIGFPGFPFWEITLSRFSFSWVVLQILLFLSFILMYRWLRLYLSLRNFAKVFFNFWISSVVLCVLIASIFVAVNMRIYEKDVVNMVNSNANTIYFQIEYVKDSNLDVLESISSDEDFLTGVKKGDTSYLEQKLSPLVSNQLYMDKIVVLDSLGQIVYDSNRSHSVGDLYSNNLMLRGSLNEKVLNYGYLTKNGGTVMESLVHQTVFPLFEENYFLGVVVAQKNIDQEFLWHLNTYNKREFLLINSDGEITSWVLEKGIGYRDAINIEKIRHLNADGSAFVQINGYQYVGSIIPIGSEGNLVVLTSYDTVNSAAKNSMHLMTLYTIALSILVAVPSYYLARRIQKDYA